MRTGSSLWSVWLAVTLAFLIGLPRLAVGQVDSRWGVLADVAERDFHVNGILGKSAFFAFRWEEPGARMSLVNKDGSFSEKWILTLDHASGVIGVVPESNPEKGAFRLKAAPSGAVGFADEMRRQFLARNDDGTFTYGASLGLVPYPPGSPSPKAAKLIAAGKLRPADPSLHSADTRTKGRLTSIGLEQQRSSGQPDTKLSSTVSPASASVAPLASPAASSDGTVEAAYKQECAANPTTQLCTALAKSLPGPSGKSVQTTAPMTPWGVFGQLAGSTWSNGSYVFYFSWHKPQKVLLMDGFDGSGSQVYMARFDAPSGNRIWVSYGGYSYKSEVLPDGSVFYRPANFLFQMTPAGSVALTYGKYKDGVFSTPPRPKYYSGTPPVGEYRRLSAEQVAAFNAFVANRKSQQAQAKADQPSMFGAILRGLAMGVSGVDAPLMNADGSEVNTLAVLNAAGAELARQNAEGQVRLDASIAQAQQPQNRSGLASRNGTAAASQINQPSGELADAARDSTGTGSHKSDGDCKETRVEAGYTGVSRFTEGEAKADVDRWAGANCGQNGIVCGASSCRGINLQGDPRMPKQVSYTCGIDATKPYRSCGASSVSEQ